MNTTTELKKLQEEMHVISNRTQAIQRKIAQMLEKEANKK